MLDLNALDSMFPSNQIFDVTCRLDALPYVIDFAMGLSGWKKCMTRAERPVLPAWQITDGAYFIGVGTLAEKPEQIYAPPSGPSAWTDYPCLYDPEVIGNVVTQWLKRQPEPEAPYTDGTIGLGARVRGLMTMPDGDVPGLKKPHDAIVAVTPFMLSYDK